MPLIKKGKKCQASYGVIWLRVTCYVSKKGFEQGSACLVSTALRSQKQFFTFDLIPFLLFIPL